MTSLSTAQEAAARRCGKWLAHHLVVWMSWVGRFSGTFIIAVMGLPFVLSYGWSLWLMVPIGALAWLVAEGVRNGFIALVRRWTAHVRGAPQLSAQDILRVAPHPICFLRSCARPWRVGGLAALALTLTALGASGLLGLHNWGFAPGQAGWTYADIGHGLALWGAVLAAFLLLIEASAQHPWKAVLAHHDMEMARQHANTEARLLADILPEPEVPRAAQRKRL